MEERDCCSGVTAEAVDELYRVLGKPRDSYEEIALETGWSTNVVGQVLLHVREHPVEHGWTVPHARRGHTIDGQARFFRVKVAEDGKWIGVERYTAIRDGARGSLLEAAAKMGHQAVSMRAVAEHVQSRSQREHLLDLAADHEYIARKTTSAARDMAVNGVPVA